MFKTLCALGANTIFVNLEKGQVFHYSKLIIDEQGVPTEYGAKMGLQVMDTYLPDQMDWESYINRLDEIIQRHRLSTVIGKRGQRSVFEVVSSAERNLEEICMAGDYASTRLEAELWILQGRWSLKFMSQFGRFFYLKVGKFSTVVFRAWFN